MEFPCSKSEKPQGDIYAVLHSFRTYTALPLSHSAEQRCSKAQFHTDVPSCCTLSYFLTQTGVGTCSHSSTAPTEKSILSLLPTGFWAVSWCYEETAERFILRSGLSSHLNIGTILTEMNGMLCFKEMHCYFYFPHGILATRHSPKIQIANFISYTSFGSR